jgi:hypothetical protein
MLRRALDVAVFAPLGAVATLTAAIARRVGRAPLPADDQVEIAPATVAPTDPPTPPPTAWRGNDDDLPIEGYDHLAASQVVDRLDDLTPRERELVATYERAHRHRQSVLAKVALLQA